MTAVNKSGAMATSAPIIIAMDSTAEPVTFSKPDPLYKEANRKIYYLCELTYPLVRVSKWED